MKTVKELGENLWQAYQNQKFCDFTLISWYRLTFRCQKIILASRSPVMKCMLNSEMKELKNNQLEINTFDSNIVALILEFMYKGKTIVICC